MENTREFFPAVRKTIMPRPAYVEERDILGQNGTAWVTQAQIFGPNWHLDHDRGLLEIYDAGPAICFYSLLPKKDKYQKEGLYLRLGLAYRTTENANVNIRNFSGNHVSLPNSVGGAIYYDPNNYHWVTDDLTININSIYAGEKIWIQRVDWEWISKEILYEDEAGWQDHYLHRNKGDIDALYAPQQITNESVKEYLANRIQNDDLFAKRCLALLRADQMVNSDLTDLYSELGLE
ncbi:MAG: hypothetical protein WAN46_01335 [Gammaproteobacteria bacterium]|jgi:hypothetical protein